jgi:hypothetical protein
LQSFKDADFLGLYLYISTRGLIARHNNILSIKDFQYPDSAEDELLEEDIRDPEDKHARSDEIWTTRLAQLEETLRGASLQKILSYRRSRNDIQPNNNEFKPFPPFSAEILKNKREARAIKDDEAFSQTKCISDLIKIIDYPGFTYRLGFLNAPDAQSTIKIDDVLKELDYLNEFNKNYFPFLAITPQALIEKKLQVINTAFMTYLNDLIDPESDHNPIYREHVAYRIKIFQKFFYGLIEAYFKDPAVEAEGIKHLKNIINSPISVLKLETDLAMRLLTTRDDVVADVQKFYQKETFSLKDANKLIDKKLAAFQKKENKLR